ncbi:hypothetical protein [Phenylobacterium sp.]|uniref:hypothetical protein n=1 Tax=Phenylobacterium sp. TaxID=1871053 RepID=UPI002B6B0BCD|nr:hypothetical protein [Phenylobacterium sp.]HLZ75726.1 hypothetical protein [Phenylobacterium sp.]
MVPGMQVKGPVVAFSVLALLLGGCGLGARRSGSAAIANFLAAAQKDDRAAFEAALDRPALRSDLSEQLADVGKTHEVDVGGPSEFALDRMISPQAIRLTAARVAPGWPAAPTAAQIVPHMKARGLTFVCLEEAATKKCLLSFRRENGTWKLAAMAFTPPPAAAATSQGPHAATTDGEPR